MNIYDRYHPGMVRSLRIMSRTLGEEVPAADLASAHDFAVRALGRFAADLDCDVEGVPIYPQHLRDLDYLVSGAPSMTAGWHGAPPSEVARLRRAYL